jgi:hypothetical protein
MIVTVDTDCVNAACGEPSLLQWTGGDRQGTNCLLPPADGLLIAPKHVAV